MAYRKTRQKAELNFSRENSSSSLSKKEKRKLQKNIKSFGVKTLCVFLIFLLLGCGIGALSVHLISRKDEFTLLGQDELCFSTNEKYVEDGYKVIEFGKDKSKKVVVETDMVINSDGSYSPKLDEDGNALVGTYYIIYKAKTFKYSTLSSIKRIRLITFVEPSEDVVEA